MKWFWQAVVSGVAIAGTLSLVEWIQSRCRQKKQIRYLRQVIAGSYKGMLESGAGPGRGSKLLRKMFDGAARQVEEVLNHGTPDLHYRRRVEAWQAHAVLPQRMESAEGTDFPTQWPSMDEYQKEFFARFEKLGWLGLDLASIRETIEEPARRD